MTCPVGFDAVVQVGWALLQRQSAHNLEVATTEKDSAIHDYYAPQSR
jgi:hypothetical protein